MFVAVLQINHDVFIPVYEGCEETSITVFAKLKTWGTQEQAIEETKHYKPSASKIFIINTDEAFFY